MYTLPRRIVLCGVSGAGKTTFGALLQARFGHRPIAFADPLKRAVQEIFGFSDEHLWGPSSARNATYEEFETTGFCFSCGAQSDGPERFYRGDIFHGIKQIDQIRLEHSDDPNYWECPYCSAKQARYVTVRSALETLGTGWGRMYCNNLWVRRAFTRMQPHESYVVTDARFRNEIEQSIAARCCVVLLRRGLAESRNPHQSEAEVRFMAHKPQIFHGVLNNTSGSVEENFEQLLLLLEKARFSTSGIDWGDYPGSLSPPPSDAPPERPTPA